MSNETMSQYQGESEVYQIRCRPLLGAKEKELDIVLNKFKIDTMTLNKAERFGDFIVTNICAKRLMRQRKRLMLLIKDIEFLSEL